MIGHWIDPAQCAIAASEAEWFSVSTNQTRLDKSMSITNDLTSKPALATSLVGFEPHAFRNPVCGIFRQRYDGVAGIHGRCVPAQRSLPRSAAPAWQRRDRDHVTADGDRAALRPRSADGRPLAATADQLRAVAHHATARGRDRPAQAAGRGGGPARRPGAGHRRLQGRKRDRRRPQCGPSGLLHRLRRDRRRPASSSWTSSRDR